MSVYGRNVYNDTNRIPLTLADSHGPCHSCDGALSKEKNAVKFGGINTAMTNKGGFLVYTNEKDRHTHTHKVTSV